MKIIQQQTDVCEICGDNLIAAEKGESLPATKCVFCKKEFDVLITCPNGHYICDQCHAESGNKAMLDFCTSTSETNPFIIADTVLNHPLFNMYGPEHHTIVPLALLTMIKNLKLKNQEGGLITDLDLFKALKRSSKIPGGWCGFYGSCGAAIGAGVAIAVFTNSNPSKAKPRSSANQTVSKGLSRIADGLEHCCKRSVKIAIDEGIQMITEITEKEFNFSVDNCHFSALNQRCEGNKCPYFWQFCLYCRLGGWFGNN